MTARSRYVRAALTVSLFSCGVLVAQNLSVIPQQLFIRQVQGGPVPSAQTVRISGTGAAASNWTASFTTADGEPWIALATKGGEMPGSLEVGLVGWRSEGQAPGQYAGSVSIQSRASTQVINVLWTVLAALPGPTFSYLSGPNGCTRPSTYPDAALCTPLGDPLPLPAVGSSYRDPTFGATVNVVTGPGVYHAYSALNPLSAKRKYLMTLAQDGTYNVVDPATGKVLLSRVKADQGAIWDADDDELYYWGFSARGTAVFKHDLRTGTDTPVIDYARDGHGFTSIRTGGTGDSSKDNWVSFFAPDEQQICALDLKNVKTYCADYGSAPGVPYGSVDYSLISKGFDKVSGKRYVILVSREATPGVYSVNVNAGKLDLEFRGPEDPESNGNHDEVCDPGEKCMYPSHSDTFEDSAGIQYLVFNHQTNSPCEVSLSTYRLNSGKDILKQVELGGGRKRVMSLWQCPYPNTPTVPEEHVGCAKKAPYCVISTGSPPVNAGEMSQRFAHANEILVMRDNGEDIRRLAQTRSVRFREEGDLNYWEEPRTAISSDGSLVVSDSNFGIKSAVRVTVIPTGYGTR